MTLPHSAQAELDEALVGVFKQGFVKLSLSGVSKWQIKSR